MYFKFVLNLLVFGSIMAVSVSQSNVLEETLSKLPIELQNKVGSVDQTQIESATNASKAAFKQKCDQNGGPNAYTIAEKAFGGFNSCVTNVINVTQLTKEVEDAKPMGQIDEVFKKYCSETPKLKNCFRNVLEAVEPCLTVDERQNLNTTYNVTEQLVEFICFKDGDRIALFIAEGGPECYQSKSEAINQCVNNTYSAETSGLMQGEFSADNLPTIEFGEKECNQMSELSKCVVGALEDCPQPTSANIVDSLFRFIRKATPCKNFGVLDDEPDARSQTSLDERGAASPLATVSTASILAAAVLLFA